MIAYKYLIALWGACLVVAGCESYAPVPLDRHAKLAERLSELEFSPAPGFLSIDAVGRLAVENNPTLKAARAQRGIAAAQVIQAGILPNPSLSGSYAFLLGGPGTIGALTASLGQDIKALVTLSAKRRAATAAAQQVDASLLWQEWQTIGKARLLVVDIVEGEKQQRLLAKTQRVLEARLGTERLALAQGNTTLTTVVPALAPSAIFANSSTILTVSNKRGAAISTRCSASRRMCRCRLTSGWTCRPSTRQT